MLIAFAPAAMATTTPDDWAMFQHDTAHHGVSAETAVGASTAPALKLSWQAGLSTTSSSSSSSSPAMVFNRRLGYTVMYGADDHGDLAAFNADTGAPVWTFHTPKFAGLSQHIYSAPAVFHGVVYFGSNDHRLWAIDSTTGALDCSFDTVGLIHASPAVVADTSGPVVYFGDEGLSGGASDGGHEWAVNGVGNTNGACTLKWMFDAFGSPPGSQTGISGTYSSPAFGTDATGRKVVVFGTTDPDDSVYSVDAETGSIVWRFQTFVQSNSDVGAGPTISSPGNNGFANGVVYITGKDKIVYALDLTAGTKIWEFSIRRDDPVAQLQTTSTAALLGRTVYVGSGVGVYALDAITGVKRWRTDTPAAVFSSPAISGANGDRVLLVGDLGGDVRALRLSDGTQLWQFAVSGASFVSSVGVSAGKVFILGTDGVAYAFSPT